MSTSIFGEYSINQDVFSDDKRVSGYPGFAYSAKPAEDGRGCFIINKELVPAPQNATWHSKGDVWAASLVRILPIHVRRRRVATLNGIDYPFSIYTSRQAISEAIGNEYDSITTHTQLLCWLADETGIHSDRRLFVLGLWGMTKTLSFDNPPEEDRWHNNTFPVGVETQMKQYAAWLGEQHNAPNLPAYCLFWVDLIPATRKNEPWLVTVGTGKRVTTVNPFTAFFGSPKVYPCNQRWVDANTFSIAQAVRLEHTNWAMWKEDVVEPMISSVAGLGQARDVGATMQEEEEILW